MRIVISKPKPPTKKEHELISIQEFAERYNLTLRVRKQLIAYAAHFSEVDVVDGGLLTSEYGYGKTITKAISDYAKKLNNAKLSIEKIPDFVCFRFKSYRPSSKDAKQVVHV